jgi:hypothetical protein
MNHKQKCTRSETRTQTSWPEEWLHNQSNQPGQGLPHWQVSSKGEVSNPLLIRWSRFPNSSLRLVHSTEYMVCWNLWIILRDLKGGEKRWHAEGSEYNCECKDGETARRMGRMFILCQATVIFLGHCQRWIMWTMEPRCEKTRELQESGEFFQQNVLGGTKKC